MYLLMAGPVHNICIVLKVRQQIEGSSNFYSHPLSAAAI